MVEMVEHAIVSLLEANWPEKGDPEQEALDELATGLQAQFGVELRFDPGPLRRRRQARQRPGCVGARGSSTRCSRCSRTKRKACDALAAEHVEIGYPTFALLERDILLQILDTQWKDHLHTMDGLREGIGLRGFAQRDPKLEYQREGYALFEDMNQRIDQQSVEVAFRFALPEPVLPGRPRPPGRGPPASVGAGAPPRGRRRRAEGGTP